MTEHQDSSTAEHILHRALHLFLSVGIKRVTMDDVAQSAGLTRVTVYRYYGGKQDLVDRVFQQIAASFTTASQRLEDDRTVSIEETVDALGRALTNLPPGDFPARLDELRRLYPDIYERFRRTRHTALELIFEHLFDAAAAQGRLRPGLDRAVVQTYFMVAVVNVIEHPQLIGQGLAPDTIFQTVKSIFLHGILTGT
ncbi:MAG: TetR/AcrR family transcriptional regulator [Chloroflexi bacterium]|nr:TetR/AcrR family transcriptional regulator [Chloroflexota bacterium]